MSPLLQTLLFATTASAQVTTSFFGYKWGYGTDKLGFVGSVVGLSGPHTTMAVTFDNGTDTNGLGLATASSTFTIGPGYFELEDSVGPGDIDRRQRLACTMDPTPTDAMPKCTLSTNPRLARDASCNNANTRYNSTSFRYFTRTNSYSGRGTYSAGVEIITRTFTFAPASTQPPEWCKSPGFIPSSGLFRTFDEPRSNFATWQLVITAGLEKLNATAGGSVSIASVKPTGSTGSPNPAGPKKTAAPVLMGLGAAAVAAFL